MTLDDMVKVGLEQAHRTLIGTREQLVPTCLLCGSDGKLTILATPWDGDFEKQLAQISVKLTMKETDCVAYSMVMEAWPASYPTADTGGVRPSQRPDRIEMVMVIATDGLHRRIAA